MVRLSVFERFSSRDGGCQLIDLAAASEGYSPGRWHVRAGPLQISVTCSCCTAANLSVCHVLEAGSAGLPRGRQRSVACKRARSSEWTAAPMSGGHHRELDEQSAPFRRIILGAERWITGSFRAKNGLRRERRFLLRRKNGRGCATGLAPSGTHCPGSGSIRNTFSKARRGRRH